MIPTPLTNGRLVVALDDFINPKVGKNIFGCATFFDHAAKANQSEYPWAQNVVCLGLLNQIKNRWACLPLASCFYLPKQAIDQKTINATKSNQTVPFENKLSQSVAMLVKVAKAFTNVTILVVCDSWFGNNGLLQPARKEIGSRLHILSRLRSNAVICAQPEPKAKPQRGRPLKYGNRLGTTSDLASQHRQNAQEYSVYMYGQQLTILAFSSLVMLPSLKCLIRVVWVYRKSQWTALFTTDLTLTVVEIVQLYAARWKIEASFKELKQEIGSHYSQTRNAHAVTNHINFCMMALSLVWIYADKSDTIPQRHHSVSGRDSFAFSDVRRLMTEAILSEDFSQVFPLSLNPVRKWLASVLLRLAA
jgi:SRSO17 transposase